MTLHAEVEKRVFHFNFRAKTSRGTMADRTSWLLKISDGESVGIGEAGPLPGLSHDDVPDFEEILIGLTEQFNNLQQNQVNWQPELNSVRNFMKQNIPASLDYSSIAFAFETALLDLVQGGKRLLFDNSFVNGKPLSINGLIWMGGMDIMLQQIEIKIREGYKCIKLKVGAFNFEKECDVLQYIRRKYFRDQISIRLDANGAFRDEDAGYKLKELSKFDIHSIEQPVKKGSRSLQQLCTSSPIPIALDEELIGVADTAGKAELLDTLRPQFIVLKPSLHGGLASCDQWIRMAEERSIGWWLTSALESSIGLNAIAQYAASKSISIPQGLGTGQIYSDNIESPLTVENGHLRYDSAKSWEIN